MSVNTEKETFTCIKSSGEQIVLFDQYDWDSITSNFYWVRTEYGGNRYDTETLANKEKELKKVLSWYFKPEFLKKEEEDESTSYVVDHNGRRVGV